MHNDDLDITPEVRLLINLSRLSFTTGQKHEIAGLIGKVTDWPHFAWLANEHGIIALVYHNIKSLEHTGRIPAGELATLQNGYMVSLGRNTILLEKFNEVQSILNKAGIEPVLIKGMALELTLYGNIGLRQMNDIDIYIAKEDCLDGWNRLIEKGYIPEPLKSRLYKKIILDTGKHLPELHRDGISFELHHTLLDPIVARRSYDKGGHLKPYASSPVKFESDNHLYSALPVEYHFLFLVKHLHYHESENGESQLRLYNDLCQVMTQCTRDIRSTGIIELAEEYGLVEILVEKLYILHIIWGMNLPGDISGALTPAEKERVVTGFLGFLNQPKGHKVKREGARYRNSIRKIPGLRKKALFILGDLFPSISFMKKRYNGSTKLTTVLYYPLRLGKLLYLLKR